MQGRDTLEGLGIGRCPVLQQATGYFHLVLFGCYMERGVTILQRDTRKDMKAGVDISSLVALKIADGYKTFLDTIPNLIQSSETVATWRPITYM